MPSANNIPAPDLCVQICVGSPRTIDQSSPVRLFITGATGFIGSHLTRLALAKNHQVLALTRTPTSFDGSHWVPSLDSKALKLAQGTLESIPWHLLRDFAPDACIHTAWISTPGVYLNSSENQSHVEWGRSLFQGLAQANCGYVLGIGTCIEYAGSLTPLNERTSALQPESPYARAKAELRALTESELASTTTGFGWARLFYPYGPGEHPQRLLSSTISRLQRGDWVELKTPHSLKDYIHVTDVATALLRIAERRYGGPINVGTGVGTRVGDLVRTLARQMNRTDRLRLGPDQAPQASDCLIADVQQLHSLGWKPEVPLELGLQALIQHLAS